MRVWRSRRRSARLAEDKGTLVAARGLVTGDDGVTRCWWSGNDELYMRYHDTEWGVPTHDEHQLFEKLCLEGFQAGLAWITILRKRDRFREVFDGFDPAKIAAYDATDVERLVTDAGIIRHRGKIEATINNARRYPGLVEEFGSLDAFAWSHAPPDHTPPAADDDIVAITEQSTQMSKDLKRRGWKFVGPTTMYAFQQAMGLVDDHIVGCHRSRA